MSNADDAHASAPAKPPAAPAVATPPKPAAKRVAGKKDEKPLPSKQRRRFICMSIGAFLAAHFLINGDAVRYSYTWWMGGITFYLFIVLTITGVLLMFYYHPTKGQAYRDIVYLMSDVPFGCCATCTAGPRT
jgi:quinol-cytochrome oxidoreductase complex cytochrome b subunit